MDYSAKPRTFIAGVGMTKFYKPDSHSLDYPELANQAMREALLDAKLSYSQVDQAYCAYVLGDSACGQRVMYSLGITGIPIFNINNNGCTGATAVYMAKQAIESGAAHCVLVVGFEKMPPGPFKFQYFSDRTSPLKNYQERDKKMYPGNDRTPFAVRIYANAG